MVQQKQAAVDRGQGPLWSSPRSSCDDDRDTIESQLAPQEATVNQAKARYDQFVRQLGDLEVKSTDDGQLQELDRTSKIGRQVGAGANLVRVSDPTQAQGRDPDFGNPDARSGDRPDGQDRHAASASSQAT